jgi:hypothetical protein
MAGGDEQHHAVGTQPYGVQARVGYAFGHHRDVGLVPKQALQHDGRIVDRQREGEALGAVAQGGHDGHDMVRRIGRDPQMPTGQRLLAGQQRTGLILHGEQPRGDAVQLAAGLGRQHAAAAPVEQAHAVGLLQRRHLARQVGLAEARGAGGGGERPGFGHQMEGAQLRRRHI